MEHMCLAYCLSSFFLTANPRRFWRGSLRRSKKWGDRLSHRSRSGRPSIIPWISKKLFAAIWKMDDSGLTTTWRRMPYALWCWVEKNWLIVGSERGGWAAALFMGLIKSCKDCEINPWEYFDDMLRRIMSHPVNRFRELLPDQWKPLSKDDRSLILAAEAWETFSFIILSKNAGSSSHQLPHPTPSENKLQYGFVGRLPVCIHLNVWIFHSYGDNIMLYSLWITLVFLICYCIVQ